MKTFAILPKQTDKSYLILVRYAENSTIVLKRVYNSISDTYMGTEVNGFGDTFRGLLRTVPNFFEVFEESDVVDSLKALGFVESNPTKQDLFIYTTN